MKKILLIILLLVLLAKISIAQEEVNTKIGDSYEEIKSSIKALNKKERKDLIKKLKPQVDQYFAQISKSNIDLQKLSLFPQEVENQQARLRDVTIKDIDRHYAADNGETYYLMQVSNKDMTIYSSFGSFAFVTDSLTAAKTLAEQKINTSNPWFKDSVVFTHLYGKVAKLNNQQYIFGIQCIEYLTVARVKYAFSPGCPKFLEQYRILKKGSF